MKEPCKILLPNSIDEQKKSEHQQIKLKLHNFQTVIRLRSLGHFMIPMAKNIVQFWHYQNILDMT